MKKIFATLLAATCALSMIGCGGGSSSGTASTAAKTEDPSAKSEGVMTYAEYDAAELDTGVTIETYVQGKQSWWDNKATLYTQDGDGGYFIFEMPMSEEEYKKLTDGTKIKVKGFKSEWSGEIEIVDATYEMRPTRSKRGIISRKRKMSRISSGQMISLSSRIRRSLSRA